MAGGKGPLEKYTRRAVPVQLLKNLDPYIQQGLQVVQQLKAEEIQNEEGLEAQIYNYMYGHTLHYTVHNA